MRLLLDHAAVLKHADETIPSARRKEHARHIVSGTIEFLTTSRRTEAWTLVSLLYM